MDTPPNAAPQRWWDSREVKKRPWGEAERKRSVPEEQQAAFVHTRQRVAAAARAVLGTAADITHEALILSVEILDLAPLPGLATAAKTLLNIWDAMQDVDMNRMACLRITERCADILYGVREEINDAGDNVAIELHDPIMKLEDAFVEVYKFLQKQVHRPFLKRYLKRDEILREIAGCDQSLNDALSLFNLSIQIRILKQVQANEARRQADTAALVRALLSQQGINDKKLLEPLNIFEPDPASTPRAAQSTDTLRLDSGAAVTTAPGTSAQKPLSTFPSSDPSTPTSPEHERINWQTTFSAIHSTAQCRALISALQGRQNDSDRSHDAADLARTMKEALSAGNDVEILSVLQIERHEIPEAIKTLQRALEREIDREAGEAEARETPVLASAAVQVQTEDWTGSVRSLASVESLWSDTPHTGESWPSSSTTGSVGEKIARKDTLDREFMEGGIEALRRLSKGPVSLPSWTITRYEVDREAKIGMGFFSDVYRGSWHGRTVAIKVLTESTPRALFKKEIEVWKGLRHRNVLLLLGASSATGDPPWFFVSPYYRNGTLAEYLRRLGSMEGVNVMRMLYEIARGMEYLHSKGIMHGDLKASNVLVSDSVRCVLCDFGQSEMKSEAHRLSGTPMPHGTLRWQAPEVMMGQSHLTWQIDSYAFGICCIEILLKGAVPWPLNDDEAVRHFVLNDNVRPPLPPSPFRTPELDALISSCLSRNPDARPAFASLVTSFKRMRGKLPPGDPEESTSPPADELPWVPPHRHSPSVFPVALPDVDPPHSPSDPRPPGTYLQAQGSHIQTIMELPEQRTPPHSIFFEHPSDSSSEVDVDMEASGMLSPNPENHFAMLARNERRYRMVLQHEFHPSLTLPLWTPGTVNIGDVGYLEKPAGVFRTLFNAFDPEKTSGGQMQKVGGLRGFGDLKIESTRWDRRTAAQKGYDAIQQLNPFRKAGTPVSGRQYTYQLRNGHKAAYLVTEITEYHYMTALDVPKKWFVANVDKVIAVYGEKHNLEKEDVFLVIGKLDAPDHAEFVSHTHPDSQMVFNVFSAPRAGSAWGEFIHQSAENNALGPHYRESPTGPFVYTDKISNAKRVGQMDSVILARLRFKPDAADPTSQ